MNKTQKLLVPFIVVAIAVVIIYAVQKNNDTSNIFQMFTETNETYTGDEYTFKHPSDFQVTEQLENVYVSNNDAENPFELQDEEIWITISPTTLEGYGLRQSSDYASDGPIAASELVKIQEQYYSVDMIIGGHSTATPEGQEVFTLIVLTLSEN